MLAPLEKAKLAVSNIYATKITFHQAQLLQLHTETSHLTWKDSKWEYFPKSRNCSFNLCRNQSKY